MCQYNSRKMNKWSTIGYRVYIKTSDGNVLSYYNRNPITEIGKRVKKSAIEPFHVWKSMKDCKEWLDKEFGSSPDSMHILIYKCKLSGELTSGDWVERDIHTVTGNNLTLLEDVTSEFIEKLTKEEYIKRNFQGEVQEKLLINLDTRGTLNDIIVSKYKLSRFIDHNMTWKDTPEGHDYWDDIYMDLHGKKPKIA